MPEKGKMTEADNEMTGPLKDLRARNTTTGCTAAATIAATASQTESTSTGVPATGTPQQTAAENIAFCDRAVGEVRQEDTEARLTDAFTNPPSTSTATGGGAATQKSESDCQDGKPAVQTCGFPSDIPEEELDDEMLIIRRILAVIDAQTLAIQRKLKRKAASQSRPCTPGTGERTNGQ